MATCSSTPVHTIESQSLEVFLDKLSFNLFVVTSLNISVCNHIFGILDHNHIHAN